MMKLRATSQPFRTSADRQLLFHSGLNCPPTMHRRKPMDVREHRVRASCRFYSSAVHSLASLVRGNPTQSDQFPVKKYPPGLEVTFKMETLAHQPQSPPVAPNCRWGGTLDNQLSTINFVLPQVPAIQPRSCPIVPNRGGALRHDCPLWPLDIGLWTFDRS